MSNRKYENGLEVVDAERWHHGDVLPQVAAPSGWGQSSRFGGAPETVPPRTARSDYSNLSEYHAAAYGGYTPSAGQEESNKHREAQPDICGIKRKVFYIVLAVGIVAVVAAIAIGVGAGLAFGRSSNDSPPDTRTSPESTATANIVCPAADNSTYVSPGGHVFRVSCGGDYNREDGAVDLANEGKPTMAACIEACAARQGCIGAGWGNYNGIDTCYMKSTVGKKNTSANWMFALEEPKGS